MVDVAQVSAVPNAADPSGATITFSVTGASGPITWRFGDATDGRDPEGNGLDHTYGASGEYEAIAHVGATGQRLTGTVTVTVVEPSDGPSITGITPPQLVAGEGYSALVVDGSGFVDGSAVEADGTAMPTSFISATRVSGADYVAPGTPGTVTFTVRNPDDAESNDWPVTVA
jgi:hypothetical protein